MKEITEASASVGLLLATALLTISLWSLCKMVSLLAGSILVLFVCHALRYISGIDKLLIENRFNLLLYIPELSQGILIYSVNIQN